MLPPKESAPANGAVGSAVASKDIRYFQWQTDTRLQRDQCAITRFGLVTERTGRIRASLQADQNTADVLAEMQKRAKEAGNPAIKQTTHIKRNEFHVVVRGYGANQTRTAPDSTALGKPLLFRVEMCPFWVQNGESRDMVWDLNVQGVKDYFDLIDRVEVDFWFR
jgi:hypothetical protein